MTPNKDMKPKVSESLKIELAQAFNQLCDYDPKTDTYDDCFTDVLAFIQKKLDQQKSETDDYIAILEGQNEPIR